MKWTNQHKKVFKNIKNDEPRIIIPLRDEKGALFGFQGRSLGKNPLKYITIMLDEESPKIYGLDKVDTSQTVYIVEGPFDSTFVKNSVALCGSDGDVVNLKGGKKVYVYDNEPRNKEIVRRVKQRIDGGESVIIWPNYISEKDINDMVLGGHNVQSVLELNTYSGLEAKLKFNNWKKI
jgi:hypothetical protein